MAKVFALTGGIGCGKSTVANMWRRWGIPIVDADQLSREVVEPGTPGLAAISAHFGPAVLQPDGALDRKELGQRVFADPVERKVLESILHPRIRAAARNAFAEATEPLVCYDVPLLFETNQAGDYRPVVVVYAHPEVQCRRIMTRNGLSRSEALRRMDSQISLDEKMRGSDYVINNSGTFEATLDQADEVLAQIKAALL